MRLLAKMAAFAVASSAFLFVAAALAQEGGSMGALQPTLSEQLPALTAALVPVIMAIGGTLGTWVLVMIAQVLGLTVDAQRRSTVEHGFERAIGYAMSQLGDHAVRGIPITSKAQAVQMATEYAMKAIPAALKYFKKSPEDVADMVRARMEGVLYDPAAVANGTQTVIRAPL